MFLYRWSRCNSVYVQGSSKSCDWAWELRVAVFSNRRWKNISTSFWWSESRLWKRFLIFDSCNLKLETIIISCESLLANSSFLSLPFIQVAKHIVAHVLLTALGMLCYTLFMAKRWNITLNSLLNTLPLIWLWTVMVSTN